MWTPTLYCVSSVYRGCRSRSTSLLHHFQGALWLLQQHNSDEGARDLQKFVFFQCILRWTALGLWAVFVALGYIHSELTNLHLATALSAVFLTSAIAILGTLVHFTVKAAQAKQHW